MVRLVSMVKVTSLKLFGTAFGGFSVHFTASVRTAYLSISWCIWSFWHRWIRWISSAAPEADHLPSQGRVTSKHSKRRPMRGEIWRAWHAPFRLHRSVLHEGSKAWQVVVWCFPDLGAFLGAMHHVNMSLYIFLMKALRERPMCALHLIPNHL